MCLGVLLSESCRPAEDGVTWLGGPHCAAPRSRVFPRFSGRSVVVAQTNQAVDADNDAAARRCCDTRACPPQLVR